MEEDGAVATTRDEDMVAIARMLAPVSGVALTGPRMDFAAARLESAGFDAAVGTRGVRTAAMLFLDPSAVVVFRMGSRSLVNAVAGYDKAAIFVEGMPEVAVASLFAAVGSRGYRLRPETAMFGNNGAIRWLIVSRRPVSAAAETIHPLSVSLARIESARLVADRLDTSGDVLVYLGEGCDGEALRSFRPGGRIDVVGESYQAVDIAQTAYGPDRLCRVLYAGCTVIAGRHAFGDTVCQVCSVARRGCRLRNRTGRGAVRNYAKATSGGRGILSNPAP
jgi:hypothetical protein